MFFGVRGIRACRFLFRHSWASVTRNDPVTTVDQVNEDGNHTKQYNGADCRARN